jgi:hypothetical protein
VRAYSPAVELEGSHVRHLVAQRFEEEVLRALDDRGVQANDAAPGVAASEGTTDAVADFDPEFFG